MEDTKRRQRIRNFSFQHCKKGNQGFKRLCLQLFGYLGHGKSSFINTCMYVWDDKEYKNYTEETEAFGGHTMERRTYPLTENVILVDNRGCATMNSYETAEIFAQLGNLLPLDKHVDYNKGFGLAHKIMMAEPEVKASDFIVPIFIYRDEDPMIDGGQLVYPQKDNSPGFGEELKRRLGMTKSMAAGEQEELKQLLFTARKLTGIVPIVVLTHKKHGNLADTENIFRDIGTDCFFSVENYTSDNHVKKKETHEAVIEFFCDVIRDVEFRMEDKRNPEKEMEDRKIFVLNYIHKREVENHKNNVERQKMLETTRLLQEMKLKKEDAAMRRQREQEKHEEEMSRRRNEYERQRERAQYQHEQRLRETAKGNDKNRKK